MRGGWPIRGEKCLRCAFVLHIAFSCSIDGPAVVAAADGTAEAPKAVALQLAPLYEQAAPGLLPAGFANKGDTCAVEKVSVDTAGTAWFALMHLSGRFYSPASNWRYAGKVTNELSQERTPDDEDRKRRLRILQQHRDWPRRIIRAVREGKICLDMSLEQLIASWDEPMQKSRCFTVGLGEHEVWLYAGRDGKTLIVSLQEGKVMGWSLGERQVTAYEGPHNATPR